VQAICTDARPLRFRASIVTCFGVSLSISSTRIVCTHSLSSAGIALLTATKLLYKFYLSTFFTLQPALQSHPDVVPTVVLSRSPYSGGLLCLSELPCCCDSLATDNFKTIGGHAFPDVVADRPH